MNDDLSQVNMTGGFKRTRNKFNFSIPLISQNNLQDHSTFQSINQLQNNQTKNEYIKHRRFKAGRSVSNNHKPNMF